MFKKIILTAALLGAASAPALAHDYTAKIDGFRQSLTTQENRLRNMACKDGKQDMCAAANSVRAANIILAMIPADASNHEVLECLELVTVVLISVLDEYALKGQFEGLNEKESAEASKALTEVQHTDGWMFMLMADIQKSEGK